MRQHGTTYASNEILQGDHKWEVTFYRVHHVTRHSKRAWSGGGQKFVISTTYAHIVCGS